MHTFQMELHYLTATTVSIENLRILKDIKRVKGEMERPAFWVAGGDKSKAKD